MPTATLPHLPPDQIDDIIYLSRAGEAEELETLLVSLSKSVHSSPAGLLAASIDPQSGNGVLHMASANGHTAVLKAMLSDSVAAGVGIVNAPNQAGNTPLHWAAMNGHLDAVKMLVEKGADLGKRNKAGWNAGDEAGRAEKWDVAGWLVAEEEKMLKQDSDTRSDGEEGGEGEGEDGEVGLKNIVATGPVASGGEKEVEKYAEELGQLKLQA